MQRTLTTFLLAVMILVTGGCEHKHEMNGQLRISTNPWVGFTPIVYAQQQGWLKESGIKFLWVVGLEENLKLYRQGLSDGFTATQYEYLALDDPSDAAPYFLFDRSVGADVILANRSLPELQQSSVTNTYLEITSLNNDLLNAFVSEHGIDKASLNLIPSDPERMTVLRPGEHAMLFVAYEPYASMIERNGFERVASSADLTSVQVIDALFINKKAAAHYRKEIIAFKTAVDRAIEHLKSDPKSYYEAVSPYLKDQSYDAFLDSLEGIEWLHKDPPAALLKHLQSQHIPTDSLLP